MKKLLILIIAITMITVLSGCNTAGITCGEGTKAEGNTCVVDDGSLRHNKMLKILRFH